MTKLTKSWKTIAIIGFRGSVSRDQNPAAHGGVCLLQARMGANGPLGREVNSNGRHEERGPAFALETDRLIHWESLARVSR